MTGNDQLQVLVDTYELHAMEWEMRADSVVDFASTAGWNDKLTSTVEDFRHQAETCRHLAEGVRESMN
jgi:hypothetical protein